MALSCGFASSLDDVGGVGLGTAGAVPTYRGSMPWKRWPLPLCYESSAFSVCLRSLISFWSPARLSLLLRVLCLLGPFGVLALLLVPVLHTIFLPSP